jgi:coenzyme Q-binding protein COQ10
MPKASLKKKINCSKENLIKMVLDIEKYPEFIPWCLNGKVHSIEEKKGEIEIIADLTIGKSFFKETYKSFVVYNKKESQILVKNIDGPLKFLENKWFFKELGKNSEIDFHINFELKNKILNIIMDKSFDIGLKKIAEAFEKRAIDLFKRT